MENSIKRIAAALTASFVLATLPVAGPASPAPRHPARQLRAPHVLADQLQTLDGATARVYADGLVQITPKHGAQQYRWVQLADVPNRALPAAVRTPMELRLMAKLAAPKPGLYMPAEVVVTLRAGVSPASDNVRLAGSALRSLALRGAHRQSTVPQYTNDPMLNSTLADLGVTQIHRLVSSVNRSVIGARTAQASAMTHHTLLDVSNSYVLHVSGMSVPRAIARLNKVYSVAYAEPNWSVVPMHSAMLAVPQSVLAESARSDKSALRRATTASATAPALPDNYTLWSSESSQMNENATGAAAAWDEIASTFNQLPGQGEIITNVSLGDVYDSNDNAPNSYCATENRFFGPTTSLIGGQRYLNWPGFPLIPAYVSDQDGHIDPSYTTCGVDPFLEEVGLDFSLMAPLPDNLQRAGEQAAGPADLTGIAPGAQYRLVVPQAGAGGFSFSETAGALLAAAQQQPAPNVITASLGYGADGVGFAGRYLEDDPLMQAVIAQIVAQGIVVCISANDGTRAFTPVAIGPSGGSVATNLAASQAATTSLPDLILSTDPSRDLDSGAIDVGGTTLDDIFSQPLGDPSAAAFRDTGAYATTRWNGAQSYSSGFGSRVNVSAPGDGLAIAARVPGPADSTGIFISGGTSASAPETAAAAAIALQVGRLTGHPFTSAADVRALLTATASAVAPVQQSDQNLNVGPQIDVRRMVETLLAQSGHTITPHVGRVGIAQRRPISYATTQDAFFVTNTDPGYIGLRGTDDYYTGVPDGTSAFAPITIAPDWEGMPTGTQYQLIVSGKPKTVLGTGPWSRLLPSTILGAVGLPLASTSQRTVSLTYRAYSGYHTLAQAAFTLTFGPSDGTALGAPAPFVSGGVVTASSATINYDATGVRAAAFSSPEIIVSVPGHLFSTHAGGQVLWEAPLTSPKGTVTVPVDRLAGDGIYQVAILGYDTSPIAEAINFGQPLARVSDFGTFRVARAGSARPPAPTIAVAGGAVAPAHFAEVPFGSNVQVSYDVSNVSGASGATIEVSIGGPNFYSLMNTFSNPNGSIRDNNGFDTGSVAFIPVSGTKGTVTLPASQLALTSTMYQNIRVIPTNGSGAAGEASEISTILTDGITTAGGDSLTGGGGAFGAGGFAINRNGTDGLIATEDLSGVTTLQSIDQTTNTISSTIAQQAGLELSDPNMYGPYEITGAGILSGDIAMFDQRKYTDFYDYYNTQFGVYNTLADAIAGSQQPPPGLGGTRGGGSGPQTITLPSQTQGLFMHAENQDTDTVGLLGYDSASGTNQLRVFAYSAKNNSILNTIDPGMGAYEDYQIGALNFAQDTSLNKAFLVGLPWGSVCQPPIAKVVDLAGGSVTQIDTSNVHGTVDGAVIDSSTHTAFIQSVCDQSIVAIDLQTGTQSKFYMPAHSLFGDQPPDSVGIGGWQGNSLAIDPVNRLLLVSVFVPNDFFTLNYNALNQVLVYDESGNLVNTLENFSIALNSDFGNDREFLQVNPATRTAYLAAGTGNQIAVFKY